MANLPTLPGLAVVGLLVLGCADDTSASDSFTSFGPGTGVGTGVGVAESSGLISATLDTLDDTAGDGVTTIAEDTTGGGADSSTGEPPVVEPGRTRGEWVGAGTRASTSTYSVVFTFGQPTAHQATHTSANYQLQGGLIGANGRPPQ